MKITRPPWGTVISLGMLALLTIGGGIAIGRYVTKPKPPAIIAKLPDCHDVHVVLLDEVDEATGNQFLARVAGMNDVDRRAELAKYGISYDEYQQAIGQQNAGAVAATPAAGAGGASNDAADNAECVEAWLKAVSKLQPWKRHPVLRYYGISQAEYMAAIAPHVPCDISPWRCE